MTPGFRCWNYCCFRQVLRLKGGRASKRPAGGEHDGEVVVGGGVEAGFGRPRVGRVAVGLPLVTGLARGLEVREVVGASAEVHGGHVAQQHQGSEAGDLAEHLWACRSDRRWLALSSWSHTTHNDRKSCSSQSSPTSSRLACSSSC